MTSLRIVEGPINSKVSSNPPVAYTTHFLLFHSFPKANTVSTDSGMLTVQDEAIVTVFTFCTRLAVVKRLYAIRCK